MPEAFRERFPVLPAIKPRILSVNSDRVGVPPIPEQETKKDTDLSEDKKLCNSHHACNFSKYICVFSINTQ